MVVIDLLINLLFLVGLTVLAVLIRHRWDLPGIFARVLLGLLFGAAAVLAMLRPLHFASGIIFDGRSIMISICGLYFGVLPALIAAVVAAAVRLVIGGSGTLMGVMVITSSAVIGCIARIRLNPDEHPPKARQLLLFGLVVHGAMVALLVLLPRDLVPSALGTLGPMILIAYPIATLLAGTVLNEQLTARSYLERLQERQQFIQTVMEHLPAGVAVHTHPPEGRITYFNSRFAHIYRVDPGMLTTTESFLNAVWKDPDQRRAIRKRVTDDIASGNPERMHWSKVPIGPTDAPEAYISVRNMPLPEQNSMITTVWDVTKEKQLEDKLMQSQKMELLGRLAGGIAHDFNNKLQIITGHLDQDIKDISREDLREAYDAAGQAAGLVKQLLAFSRQQVIEPEQLDLNESISRMLSMVKRLIGTDISLHWKPGDRLEKVIMDPVQLDQVITNLCVNARDAMEGPGEITISTAMVPADTAEKPDHPSRSRDMWVVLTVTDTGSGMDAATMDHIFEPFFTTKAASAGTGLGLATVYGIVKQHGAVIDVTSSPGKGTTFTISFKPVIPDAALQQVLRP